VTTIWFPELLEKDDHAELWRVALDQFLTEVRKKTHITVEVGRCSHWLRPHQSQWTADGGFAWACGYRCGSGGHHYSALPQFDWSVVLRWNTGSVRS
jgi:hypothetical protein